MTTIQKTLMATAFIAALGIAVYEARRVSDLQRQVRALVLRQNSLTEQNQQLQRERDQAVNRLAATQPGTGPSRDELANLLKLRAEVTKLRGDSRELAQLKGAPAANDNDPTAAEMKSWLARINKLKTRLEQMPDQKIPEFQFLTDKDWVDAIKDHKQLESEADFGQALTALRNSAKNAFASALQNALRNYAQTGNGQPPTDLSQLKPYFASPFDDAILQRYAFTEPGIVTERTTPLDDRDDNYFQISIDTINSSSVAELTLEPSVQAFSAANNGQLPADPAQLLPYVKTPAEQAALQKIIQRHAGR